MFANLVGARRDSAVSFTKTYDRPDSYHSSPIFYEGVLSGDGSEIEGRWTIANAWSGKFLMIRSPDRKMKAAGQALERA